jgi:hypothetical protein
MIDYSRFQYEYTGEPLLGGWNEILHSWVLSVELEPSPSEWLHNKDHLILNPQKIPIQYTTYLSEYHIASTNCRAQISNSTCPKCHWRSTPRLPPMRPNSRKSFTPASVATLTQPCSQTRRMWRNGGKNISAPSSRAQLQARPTMYCSRGRRARRMAGLLHSRNGSVLCRPQIAISIKKKLCGLLVVIRSFAIDFSMAWRCGMRSGWGIGLIIVRFPLFSFFLDCCLQFLSFALYLFYSSSKNETNRHG